jgi:predicted transcriptional regulator
MPMHLLDRVDEIADELQTSRSALIIEALEQWLQRREEQK